MGYNAATINKNLHSYHHSGAEEALNAAGGKHLKRQDVINAGLSWKKTNPDIRQVGAEGYSWEEQRRELVDWLESVSQGLKSMIY